MTLEAPRKVSHPLPSPTYEYVCVLRSITFPLRSEGGKKRFYVRLAKGAKLSTPTTSPGSNFFFSGTLLRTGEGVRKFFSTVNNVWEKKKRKGGGGAAID